MKVLIVSLSDLEESRDQDAESLLLLVAADANVL